MAEKQSKTRTTGKGRATTRQMPRTSSAKAKSKGAPTEPPTKVNEKDQQLLATTVVPASGYVLAHLVTPKDRERIGFSKHAIAFQSSALLQIMRTNKADDSSGYDAGDLVFASLDEVAPLLNTLLYLVPLVRIHGHIPTAHSEVERPFGFAQS